jgi:carboxylesterase type B
MDRDVVLVTVNYRLGALGFLATGTSLAVGNMGLKDQAFAIQWVNRNIAKFGGDPESVTLAGLSAGAYSTTALMVSEMSKDLIHGVIAMSGAITWQKGLQNSHVDKAQELAASLNCSTDVNELVDCLREKDAFEIAVAAKYSWHNCPVSCVLNQYEII